MSDQATLPGGPAAKRAPDVAPGRAPGRFAASRLAALGEHKATWPLVALAIILIVAGFIAPNFYEIRIVQGRLFGNLIDILYRAAPTALIALGMAIVIGARGIDLSVGSVVAIVGAVIAWRIHMGDPHGLVLVYALLAGIACGIWNGTLVAGLGIQPIIATLVLMVSGRGIGLLIDLLYGGTDPSFESPLLQGLSTGHLWLIPTRLILFVAIFAALWLLIRRTALGLFIEAVGGNAAAANLSGVNARLVTFMTYVACALLTAWAGVILTADTHTSDPVTVALYIELDAILAVVIGGGALAGGRIHLGSTVIGVLVIQALTTTTLISGLPPEYNLVVKALVVLFVLFLQSDNARKALLKPFSSRGAR